MKVGDEYSSYEEFKEALNKYKKSVSNEYWIRDARTIANQKRRFPDTVDKINESLKYYYIRLACVKGGRPFKSKNDQSKKKCTTVKQDCGATIFLRLSPSQKTLMVVELNEKHNHATSKSYFDFLSQKMKVGDEYSSYEEFEEALYKYKKRVSNEYWIRDARTIANQKRRFPDTVDKINESLKYYYIRLACVKGGRPFKSKNDQSSKKCTTLKQDCGATIFLRLSPSQKTLKVVELNEKHNHATSKSYFDFLSQQRLPKTVKKHAKECLKAGANKKIVLDHIQQQTGCKITLKDLTNLTRRTEKKSLAECVDLLKNTYKCSSIEVWIDENSVFKGLYFQDERMKKYCEAFPEILFVDGTYCLVDLRTATYIIMVENGNGLSEIVAVCLLVDEDEESLDFFIDNFKKCNPSWNKVKVVMSDKDRTKRKVFSKHFPDAKLIICLFHVFQIFNREISVKKMSISTSEVQKSKSFLQKLTYAESEHEYKINYEEMINNVPQNVKDYYEKNWAPITDQWVNYQTIQNLCLSNTTNNHLENLNSHLKSVITRYSPLEDFIKHLFVYINCFRAGQDVKILQMLNKRSAKKFLTGSIKSLYCQLLTTFAFKQVERQLELANSCSDFQIIEDDTFLVVSTEGLLRTTPFNCECMFYKSNNLPCRHIFKCRKLLELSLFEPSLCLNRWTRAYSEQILQECESNLSNTLETANTKDISVKVTNTKPKSMTSHQKFKIIDDQGKMMAKLCSEVSTPIFHKRLEFIQNVIKLWSEGKDTALNNIFSEVIEKIEDINNSREINYNKTNEVLEDCIKFKETEIEYIEENAQVYDPPNKEAIKILAEQADEIIRFHSSQEETLPTKENKQIILEDLKTEKQQISAESVDEFTILYIVEDKQDGKQIKEEKIVGNEDSEDQAEMNIGI